MHDILLQSHSYLRYFILIMLLVVIVKSTMGWIGNKPYTGIDNKLSLYLVIFTHLQLVAGIILYFTSDLVQFNSDTMKNAGIRYWTVEHAFAMVIAVGLITTARSSSKKMATDLARHRRLVLLNVIALAVILGTLTMSGRKII